MAVCNEVDVPSTLKCLKHMDHLLRCPICFDYLNITMMNKCSHNFCSFCIRKFLSYKRVCPVCNSAMTESDLRNNRILDDVVKSFQQTRNDLSKILCESPNTSGKKQKLQRSKGTILSHFLPKRVSQTDELKVVIKDEPSDSAHLTCQSSQLITSPSTSHDTKPAVKVECPVCGVDVAQIYINNHLDVCLTRDEKKESLRSGRNKQKPMAKLVYTLLSKQDLKKRLKDVHLSTQGSREQLERRHHEFVLMYNAQCDSLTPKSVEEIADEVEKIEEMKSKLQSKNANAMFISKKPSEEEIQAVHSKYRKQHSAEFSTLIAQVKSRLKSSKKEPKNKRTKELCCEEQQIDFKPKAECSQEPVKEEKQNANEEETSPSASLSNISISSSISDVFSMETTSNLDQTPDVPLKKRKSASNKVQLVLRKRTRHS